MLAMISTAATVIAIWPLVNFCCLFFTAMSRMEVPHPARRTETVRRTKVSVTQLQLAQARPKRPVRQPGQSQDFITGRIVQDRSSFLPPRSVHHGPRMAPSLLACLEGVSDPRSTHARGHPLTSILFLALDGKTARRSHDRSHGRSALHTVSAYACENRLVLALLDLTGTTVTVDAMGCQKDLARHIRSQQADYVLAIKDNQRTLRAALEETFAEERRVQFEDCPHTAHRTVNGGHGRIEIRRGWALGTPEYL